MADSDGDGDDDERDDDWHGSAEGAGAGASSSSSSARMTCETCGGPASGLFTTSAGEVVCGACGTLSQHDTRQSQLEEFDAAGTARGAGGQRIRARTGPRPPARGPRLGEGSWALPAAPAPAPARLAFNEADFLHAAQALLRAQALALVRELGAPRELLGAVGRLWGAYLDVYLRPQAAAPAAGSSSSSSSSAIDAAPAPTMRVVGGRLLDPSSTGYQAAHAAEGRGAPPAAAPLSALLLLGCSYCGLRWLGSDLLAHDVAAAAAAGALPFLRGSAALTADQRLVLRAALPLFDAREAPSAEAVERAAIVFFRSCGAALGPATAAAAAAAAALPGAPAALPRVNVLPCALRLIRRAGLPDAALAPCAQLLALIEHDRAHESAYSVYAIAESSRKGVAATAAAAAAAANHDEDDDDDDTAIAAAASGAAAAAAPAKPRRLPRVREAPLAPANELARLRREAPDSDGGAGARVAALVCVAFRLLAGWERWVEERLQPGAAGDDDARALRAGLPRAPAAASLPLSVAPELLASAPAPALARFARLLGADVLPGGDVGAGRGARGYPVSEYRADDVRPEGRRVAVADAALALLLRGRAAATRAGAGVGAGAGAGAGWGAGVGAGDRAAVAGGAAEVDLDIGRREDFPFPGGSASEAALAAQRRQMWPRALLDEVATCSAELEALGGALDERHARAAGAAVASGTAGGPASGGGAAAQAPRAPPAAASFLVQARSAHSAGAQPHRGAALGALCPRARALAAMLARLVGAREEQVLLRCEALELLVELYSAPSADAGGAAEQGARRKRRRR